MKKIVLCCDRCEYCIEGKDWKVKFKTGTELELCYACYAHFQEYMDKGGSWEDYIFNELDIPKEGGIPGVPVPVVEEGNSPYKRYTIKEGDICFHD